MSALRTCRQCFEEYVTHPSARIDDGFCSDPCEQQYDREIAGSEDPTAIGPDLYKLVESIVRNTSLEEIYGFEACFKDGCRMPKGHDGECVPMYEDDCA